MSTRLDRRALLGSTLAVGFIGSAALAASPPSPPLARVAPVSEDHFGTRVADPYRWMEAEDAEWSAYARAQGAYTSAVLESIPGRAGLLEAADRYFGNDDEVIDMQVAGGRVFTLRPAAAGTVQIHVRDGAQAKDRLLLDPVTLGGEHAGVDWWQVSHDGRHLAFGYSIGGTEQSVARFIEVETGRLLPETVDRSPRGRSWSPDGSGFFYSRLKAGGPTAGPDRLKDISCWFHRLHTDPADDVLVMGPGRDPELKLGGIRMPGIITAPGSPVALARIVAGVEIRMELHIADVAEAQAGKPRWRKLCDASDQVVSAVIDGRDIYLLTYRDAPRGRILKVTADRPAIEHAVEVLRQSDAVLQRLIAAGEGLYVVELDAGLGGLKRIGRGGGVTQVKTPISGSLSLVATDPKAEGVWIVMEGWVRPPQAYWLDRAGQAHASDLAPARAIDVSPYVSEEVMVTARDGVRVPLSISYRKGLVRNGSAPLVIEAYGAYGESDIPRFASLDLPFLDLGGVSAVAHVRGGGELGEDWHKAGQKQTKPNTWRDLIDCAEYLIANRYTRSSRLAVLGGSAGGITVGRFMTERPDLAAVVISIVGVSNPLRMAVTPGGPLNFPEFGAPTDPEGFKGLLEMDAYQHVRDGTAYPAVLLLTGLNDPRVPSWQATKMLARLQAASTSGKPVMLRLNPDSGHASNSRAEALQNTADLKSFVLWNLGEPGFAPMAVVAR